MSLINCPECGREVSDEASCCISCGFPLDNKKHPKRIYKGVVIVCIVVLFAILILIGVMFNTKMKVDGNKSLPSNSISESNENNTVKENVSEKETMEQKQDDNNIIVTHKEQTTVSGIPDEKEYAKFICDYYNKQLNNIAYGYYAYNIDKHSYQFYLGVDFIESYEYLANGSSYESYRMFDEVYSGLFTTFKDLSYRWSQELEYDYGYGVTIEVLAPEGDEVLFVAKNGEATYCAYFEYLD